MIGYAVTLTGGIVGGIAIGIIIDRMLIAAEKNKTLERTKLLEECFGEPMYSSTFSLNEMRDWIKSREEIIVNGAKAVVMKVNEDTLKTLGKELDIGSGVDNYLILAIIDEEKKDLVDSALVKYDTLDERLEQALSKGNGVLVVEG